VVLKTAKALKRMEGRLTLCNMQDYVREVFEIAGFDTILPIAPSLEAAMKDLGALTA
jgi:anti-anti-sigma factor